jgi:diguanylate cyclase (GGDEF)-like protein
MRKSDQDGWLHAQGAKAALREPVAADSRLLRQPARIARRYAIFALIWLGITDLLLARSLTLSWQERWVFVVVKGIAFVLASAGLILYLQRRMVRAHIESDGIKRSLLAGYIELFRSLPSPSLIADPVSQRILDANGAALRLFGCNIEALRQRHFHELLGSGMTCPWPISRQPTPLLMRSNDRTGAEIAVEWTANQLPAEHGSLLMLTGNEMTAQSHADELRRLQAHIDQLTGLPSRVSLQSRIERMATPGATFALLMLDIDHFRAINEMRGPSHGDLVLRQVATRLRDYAGAQSYAARCGSDEFMLLAGDVGTVEQAVALGEFVLESIASELRGFQHYGDSNTCSMGIALYPDHGHDPDELLGAVEMALQQAKSDGRGRLSVFSAAMRTREQLHMTLAERLHAALQGEGLYLRYQPQFTMMDGRICGMEALCRWRLADGNEVPVMQFIATAERCGLIHELGRWIFREAARQLSDWRARGIYAAPMAINVSPRQLTDPGFVEFIVEVLAGFGLPAHMIDLEITETVALYSGDEVRDRILKLAALGFGVSVDDFGTGYSSLSHFKRLPVSKLKIDVLFVRNVHHAQDSQAIVKAMLHMAAALKIGVVAEGVESHGEAEWLRAHGCEAVQGFLYALPLQAHEFEAFVSRRAQRTG